VQDICSSVAAFEGQIDSTCQILALFNTSWCLSLNPLHLQSLDKNCLGPLRKAYRTSLNLLLRREVRKLLSLLICLLILLLCFYFFFCFFLLSRLLKCLLSSLAVICTFKLVDICFLHLQTLKDMYHLFVYSSFPIKELLVEPSFKMNLSTLRSTFCWAV